MRSARTFGRGLGIALALGAATTVTVSWTAVAAFAQDLKWGDFGQIDGDDLVTRFNVRYSLLLTEVSTLQIRPSRNETEIERATIALFALPHWSKAQERRLDFRSTNDGLSDGPLIELATGWPMRAMMSELMVNPSGSPTYVTLSGIPLEAEPIPNGFMPQARALPLRALPLGFTIDTLLFASAWWLLLFAFPTVRRIRRHRRGACLRCGYGPLLSRDARCPECGSIRGERPVAA